MKCTWCGKDKSYWDMEPMPLTKEQKTYPITPARDLVCHTCLGWNEPKPKKNLFKSKRFRIF